MGTLQGGHTRITRIILGIPSPFSPFGTSKLMVFVCFFGLTVVASLNPIRFSLLGFRFLKAY